MFAKQSCSWKKISAEIIESEIGTGWTRSGSKKYYRPTIRYRYTFQGQTYECENFNFLIDDLSKEDALLLTQAYYLGREIDVFVNPNTPKIAVVKPGLQDWHLYAWILCCVLFFGSLYFLRDFMQ